MDRARTGMGVAVVGAALVALLGCGGGGAGASPTGAATSVDVTLQEWAVATSTASAPAGPIRFVVTNNGPDDMHEFVVIKTDLSLVELPTDADGAVDEAGGGMEVEGEIEDVAVGATQELTLDLDAGAYVLLCNIYTEEEDEAHYELGMRTSFTVTE